MQSRLSSRRTNGVPALDVRCAPAPAAGTIDKRWLAGTVLSSGIAGLLVASALGGAVAHLGERRSAKDRPAATEGRPAQARRGDRPVTVAATPPPRDRVIRVPTVTREGNVRVVRKKPFGYAAAPLAVAAPSIRYAAFDPLAIYATSGDDRMDPSLATIYDADVESEVTLQRVPFDPSAPFHPATTSDRLVRQEVVAARAELREADRAFAALQDEGKKAKASLENAVAAIEGVSPVARATSALSYAPSDAPVSNALNPLAPMSHSAEAETKIEPFASGRTSPDPGLSAATLSAALTLGSENVSRVEQSGLDAWSAPVSREAMVTVKTESAMLRSILGGLSTYGADRPLLLEVARALDTRWGRRANEGGSVMLRLAWRAPADDSPATDRELRRVSVYEADSHIVSLARDDGGAIVEAPAPATIEVDAGEREKRRIALSKAMPSIYDGLMRAALSQGLTPDHARRLVRTMAFDVDFRAKVSPEDRLEVFYSLAEGTERPSVESQILYAAATIGGTTRHYYRFAHSDADGETITDFYDATGRSAKKFLLRRPVPNGRFTSGYGMRRHPISRYRKMHTGVDWAARSGTPILSAGNGTVIKRGWAGGYGRQIKIRHANGYVTSYSHLRRFARGLKVGSTVRQGQRIGQVGTSGASTGPHLHYEVSVNGRRVNPMRIRLPKGKTLDGPALVAFKRERDRVDALVERGRGNVEVASN